MADPLPDPVLDQLFRHARTANAYLDRAVGEELLRAIWDLVKMGPTSANMLPARLFWCVSDDAKARLASCAMPKNAEKIIAAPVSVLIGMDLDFPDTLADLFPHDPTAKDWFPTGRDVHALRNSSLQGGYFILAARALGLDTGPMSGFDNDKADALFFAGTSIKSNFLSTLGYADPAGTFERLPRPPFERFNTIL